MALVWGHTEQTWGIKRFEAARSVGAPGPRGGIAVTGSSSRQGIRVGIHPTSKAHRTRVAKTFPCSCSQCARVRRRLDPFDLSSRPPPVGVGYPRCGSREIGVSRWGPAASENFSR
jgi:hypothetical protein